MKKILFVIPTLRDGGAERSLVNLLCELPKDVYEIDLLLFKMQGTFLPQVPKNVNILEQPTILKKLYGPIRKAGIYMPVKVVGNVLARIIKSGMPKKYDLKLFSKVDAIVTISDECLQILSEEFPEFQNKCFCVANITSSTIVKQRAEEFRPKEYEKENNIILSIGRLSEQKGFDMAITAARIIKTKGIKFKWFIIGSGPLNDELSKQIQKENVADCIQLLGSRENPYPYIKECDIFAQTSRYEGKSVVLDEAKILGKPIVVTKYPTVYDQIHNDDEGKIVEMNPQGIAEGISKLIIDKDRRIRMQKYLKSKEYGNQEEIKKYIDIIENR